jgi:hypothetical protein
MAASYTVVSQRKTVQQLAGNQVIDVEEVGFVTIPTGIYAQVYVPYQEWLANRGAQYIDALATGIENLIAGGLADSGSFAQDIDPNTDLLADFIDFRVSYTPPTPLLAMTTDVRIPVSLLGVDTGFGSFISGGTAADQLRAAYDELAATAEL